MTLSDELGRLADLHARGTLSDEEFARAKRRLLDEQEAGGSGTIVSAVNRLRRSRGDQWIGGVCGGIARSTGMESWAWRLIFVALLLFGGTGLLLYVLLWIFVPAE
jgi:phage shock protein PspC (stress-responsive transcriptional regulator)